MFLSHDRSPEVEEKKHFKYSTVLNSKHVTNSKKILVKFNMKAVYAFDS